MLRLYHPVVNICLGILLLLSGRNLFWLFIGAVGFLGGLEIAQHLLIGQSPVIIATIGIVFGIVGLVLAILFQKIAIIFAGIMAGGLVGIEVFLRLWPAGMHFVLLSFILGALLGGLLMAIYFEWMLIILSSFTGAHLALEPFYLGGFQYQLIFSLLFIFGIIFQFALVTPNKTTVNLKKEVDYGR